MANIYIDPATLAAAKAIAEREDRKVAAVLKRAVARYETTEVESSAESEAE